MTDVFFVSCGRQYALLWSTLFLYQHPKNEKTKPSDIKVRSPPPLSQSVLLIQETSRR